MGVGSVNTHTGSVEVAAPQSNTVKVEEPTPWAGPGDPSEDDSPVKDDASLVEGARDDASLGERDAKPPIVPRASQNFPGDSLKSRAKPQAY